jgi:hypothetical protein
MLTYETASFLFGFGRFSRCLKSSLREGKKGEVDKMEEGNRYWTIFYIFVLL